MDISAIGGSSLDFQSMKNLLRGEKQLSGTEETLTQSVVEQVTASAAAEQSSGIMSRNFASAPKADDANYAQKTLEGKQAASAQASRQNAVLNSAMAQMENADSYTARALAGKRAARSMMQEMQRTVQEESERNLKENRNAVEAAAGEAVAQGSAPAANVAAPVTAASAAAAPASDSSTSGSAPAAPSAPSIDVTV